MRMSLEVANVRRYLDVSQRTVSYFVASLYDSYFTLTTICLVYLQKPIYQHVL
jgi:hypothetical protein